MAHLRPCDGCLRHVRANETRCPFCDHALAIDTSTPATQSSRLGRAARMAVGAAVATSIAAACGGGNKPAETSGAGEVADAAPAMTGEPTATTTAMPTGSASTPPPPPDIAKPYGAPPAAGLLV